MPKPKGAGGLRDRVRFYRRSPGRDAHGNAAGGWIDQQITRAAAMTPTRGGETVHAGRVAGVAEWDIWLRYDRQVAALSTGDRVVDTRDDSRSFIITFIGDMDGDRRWLLIQGKAGLNDG